MKTCTVAVLLALTTLFGNPLYSQTVIGPKGPHNPEKKTPPPGEKIYKREFHISPAAEPDPVLKYSLYTRVDKLQPGNSVPMWYRAIHSLRDSKQVGELYNAVDRNTVQGEAIPIEEIRKVVRGSERVFRAMHIAAQRRDTVWDLQFSHLRGRETIEVSLGEFQEGRELARLLSLKTRLHIEEGDYEAALAEMRVSLRLAHDIAMPDSIINNLIGIAIQSITFANIEQFITKPDAPNLYWALAAIPDPLIDVQPPLEFEMTLPERYFPWLNEPDDTQRTPAAWQQLMRETFHEAATTLVSVPGLRSDSPQEQFDIAYLSYAQQQYPLARKLLVEQGHKVDDIEAMPSAQVLALSEKLLYRKNSQLAFANTLLPMSESEKRYAALRTRLQNLNRASIVAQLLPGFQQVYVASERRNSFRNAVMVIEAIRMHMAAHAGQAPQSLSEITIVPVPKFTFTDEPFGYKIDGKSFVIDVPIPYYHVQYVIGF